MSLLHHSAAARSTRAFRRYFSAFTASKQQQRQRPVALFLNCSRLDYDRKLDFTSLQTMTDFRRNDQDYVIRLEDIMTLVDDHQPEIVITKEMHVHAEAVQDFPDSVKLLCEAGTGYNNLPLEACRSREILVCNIPTYSTDAVAHTATTYLMNFSINLLEQQRMLQNGDRSNFTGPFTLPLQELGGKTLGLVGGSGRIGSKVAEIALALGMHIVISSRGGTLPDTHPLCHHPNVQTTSDLDFLLQQSDFVSIHTPLNADTAGTFGRAQVQQMKPTAYLINTSRGKVCREDEVIACVKEGMIAGAGLDVTSTEPPAMDSEIWKVPNIWLSPHIGWRRYETRQRLVDMTCDNIRSYIDGTPINVDKHIRQRKHSTLFNNSPWNSYSPMFKMQPQPQCHQQAHCRCMSTDRRKARQQNRQQFKSRSKGRLNKNNNNKPVPIRPPRNYQDKLPKSSDKKVIPPALLASTASPYVYVSQAALVMDNTDEEGQPPTLMDTSSLFSEAMAGGVQASTLASKGSFDYFSPKHDLQHDYPTHGAPEVAVLGRSNVGKSSLVNSVLQKSLCITSKSPGRTQLPHYYGWRAHGAVRMDLSKTASTKSSGKDPSTVQGYIVDLPGYGFGNAPTSVVEGWQQNTQDWLLHRRHEAQVLKRLFLLMDARRDEPNDWDRTVLRWLEDAEIPYTIVLTKADRVSVPLVVKQVNDFCLRYASQESEAEERMDDEGHVPFVAQSPVVHVTSSKRGWGIAELILSIETEFFGEDELLESIE